MRAGRAAGLRLLAAAVEHLEERLGPVRLMLSRLGAALGRADRGVHRRHRHRRSTRATASPRPRRWSPPPCAASRLQPGSVGAALPGIEIRLVDEHGREPEGDDPGEIQIRGDNLFSGYWPDGADGPDDEGWWATGDVGFLDASGDLFLVDRLKELVIVSGFNVYPSEVEEVIARGARGGRGGRDRRRRRAHRRGRRRLREGARRAPTATLVPTLVRRALRRAGWPGSSSRRGSRSSTSCPTRSPARCRRAGCAATERRRALGLLE